MGSGKVQTSGLMGVEKQCDYYSEQYGRGGCCPRGRLLILFHVRVGPHVPPSTVG